MIKKKTLLLLLSSGLLFLSGCTSFSVKQDVYSHAMLKPVSHKNVELAEGYWDEVRTRSRDIGVPTLQVQFEKHGYIDNFRICSAQTDQSHIGGANNNEFIYKQLEAMSWYSEESNVIKVLFEDLAEIILSAQQPDGYLNTYYENPQNKHKGMTRFAPMNRFEFYNFGHFTQAAIAHYQASGERDLLDAAISFADLIVGQFADPKDLPYKQHRGPVNVKYEHPNHELAMVELYRFTGDRRYLDFALQTYSEYGYFEGIHFNEMWGHAVQENLLEAGAVDVYLETGDQRIWEVVSKLRDDMHDRKMYITGGTGASSQGESFGKAFELPNASAYSETCAAIALTFWHYKMLLATGDGKFADEMERTIYNNVLAGYGLDGWSYSYTNPLDWDPKNPQRPGQRHQWHTCPCCPPNIHRFFAVFDQYIYTSNETGVQVNIYANSTLSHTLPDGNQLNLKLTTKYPWKEKIEIDLDTKQSAKGTLSLRIPHWCKMPDVMINNKPIKGKMVNGYLLLEEPWKHGEKLELTLTMPVSIIKGNPKSIDQVGRIAIQRGPIVYCLEQADNPRVDVDSLYFKENSKFTEKFDSSLLGGVVQIQTLAVEVNKDNTKREVQVQLIPYYTWANREPGRMMVWLLTKASSESDF